MHSKRWTIGLWLQTQYSWTRLWKMQSFLLRQTVGPSNGSRCPRMPGWVIFLFCCVRFSRVHFSLPLHVSSSSSSLSPFISETLNSPSLSLSSIRSILDNSNRRGIVAASTLCMSHPAKHFECVNLLDRRKETETRGSREKRNNARYRGIRTVSREGLSFPFLSHLLIHHRWNGIQKSIQRVCLWV